MNKAYNGRFDPELSSSMLQETIALFRDYIYENRKEKAKLSNHITYILNYIILNYHYHHIYHYKNITCIFPLVLLFIS